MLPMQYTHYMYPAYSQSSLHENSENRRKLCSMLQMEATATEMSNGLQNNYPSLYAIDRNVTKQRLEVVEDKLKKIDTSMNLNDLFSMEELVNRKFETHYENESMLERGDILIHPNNITDKDMNEIFTNNYDDPVDEEINEEWLNNMLNERKQRNAQKKERNRKLIEEGEIEIFNPVYNPVTPQPEPTGELPIWSNRFPAHTKGNYLMVSRKKFTKTKEKEFVLKIEEETFSRDPFKIIKLPLSKLVPPKKTRRIEHALEQLNLSPEHKSIWDAIATNNIRMQFKKHTRLRKKNIENCIKVAKASQHQMLFRVKEVMDKTDKADNRARTIASRIGSFVKTNEGPAADKRRKKEAKERDAERQKNKLNYLITRTELYSHFMAKRIGYESQTEENLSSNDIVLRERAMKDVEQAMHEQGERIRNFDEKAKKHRDLTDTNRFDEPPEGIRDVPQPIIFIGQLKSYQLQGLSWLVNLYEQDINGILADEMGLGKTIQTIAFLLHLAEEKGIWGPFLVVAPNSTLPNWVSEIKKFTKHLKVMPYWGTVKQRVILRKFIKPDKLYSRDSVFHVLVTSYSMIVSDKKVFQGIQWEYMVLDEAQKIKNANSLTWNTLREMKDCRNRLLLTGTPIQNNMSELWALLHFIMPTLFDNHTEFSDWFSKDIEGHAENKSVIDRHILERLYTVLKPFMLRRVKDDVLNEIPSKTIEILKCELTPWQKELYNGVAAQMSVSDLLKKSKNKKNKRALMNLVMQFRKICNHPEILESKESKLLWKTESPFSFVNTSIDKYTKHNPDVLITNHFRNPIVYNVPRIVYNEGIFHRFVNKLCTGMTNEFEDKWLFNKLSIFTPEYIHSTMQPDNKSDCWSFSRFIDMTPAEIHEIWSTDNTLARTVINFYSIKRAEQLRYYIDNEFEDEYLKNIPINSYAKLLIPNINKTSIDATRNLNILSDIIKDHNERIYDNRSLLKISQCYLPKVIAPAIDDFCSDPKYELNKRLFLSNGWMKSLLGIPSNTHDHLRVVSSKKFVNRKVIENTPQHGILKAEYDVIGTNTLKIPGKYSMMKDSGKLRILSRLLKELKNGGHKVLIYSQMTRMLDILTDFILRLGYMYVRLDGQSKMDDRRESVNQFQNDDNVFIFLLSTRAGGLGINLTAADTVIFYDSDWNPMADAQAMDRAHRLGQTRDVTVYRLVTKNTVEERILLRAEQKQGMQDLVIGNGSNFDKMDNKLWNNTDMVDILIDPEQLVTTPGIKRKREAEVEENNKRQKTD
eukprot:TRINITY_DN11164_c0_g1_i1.p1 TRINITY_DN11164_c0_g1~~TRINITY_DN11164_c0_g1_i1.p1  ORF type:complete len:1260 (+),score=260.68 TRINITY_DN11164_c0_g1_i1:53-3832(+)